MLATTRKKPIRKISEITFDLEIINPIESKNLFGGCEYSWCNCSNYDSNCNPSPSWGDGLAMGTIGGSLLGGNGGYGGGNDWNNNYDNSHDYDNNHSSDWNDSNNDGISDENEILIQNYPGENLTFNEKIWLLNNLHHLKDMIENKDLAEVAGRNQHNGVFDALRHALWSALDAFDLGGNLAESFHTLHETEHWNDIESPSDLNNNSWGYQWALINGNAQNNMAQFNIDFNAAVANGEITIIP